MVIKFAILAQSNTAHIYMNIIYIHTHTVVAKSDVWGEFLFLITSYKFD